MVKRKPKLNKDLIPKRVNQIKEGMKGKPYTSSKPSQDKWQR